MSPFFIQTFTGIDFDLLEPKVETINLIDIAHSLSMNCRYNGHASRHYSVAEHSVLLAKEMLKQRKSMDEEECRGASIGLLFHDAHEAYTGDVTSPLKRLGYLAEIAKNVDARIERVMCKKLGISRTLLHSPLVKEYDMRILHDEKRALLSNKGKSWNIEQYEPLGVQIQGWKASRARREFMEMVSYLIPGQGDLFSLSIIEKEEEEADFLWRSSRGPLN